MSRYLVAFRVFPNLSTPTNQDLDFESWGSKRGLEKVNKGFGEEKKKPTDRDGRTASQ